MSNDDNVYRDIKRLKADVARLKTHETPGTVNDTTGGLVPPYPGGTEGFFRSDGNWGTPAAGGNIGTIFTETGQIIYASGSGTAAVLSGTTDGYVLTAGGVGTAPYWASAPAAVVADNSITYAKLQDMAGSCFIGHMGAGTTDPAAISLLTSDGVSTNWSVGGQVTVGLTNGSIAYAKLAESAPEKFLGRRSGTGAIEPLSFLTSDGISTNWTVGGCVTLGITNGSITLGKLQNISPQYILARRSGTGAPEQLALQTTGGVTADWSVGGCVTIGFSGSVVNYVDCDSGAGTASSNRLKIAGGEGIDTSGAGTVITIACEDATSTNKGAAAFGTADFTMSGGTVAMRAGGHPPTYTTSVDWVGTQGSALTSASFDGDSFSDTAKTLIDLSAVFGVPAGIKAVYLSITTRDSASSSTNYIYGGVSPNNSAGDITVIARCAGLPNDYLVTAGPAWCPCDSNGDIYYQVDASGSATLDMWIAIHGYQK